MMTSTTVSVLIAIALLHLLRLAATAWNARKPPKGLRAVPGPKPAPIVGNLLQIPSPPQRQLEKWAWEYGELYKLRPGWEEWIYANSPESVKDIFDKQSQHTSSRMPSPVLSDALSGGMRFAWHRLSFCRDGMGSWC